MTATKPSKSIVDGKSGKGKAVADPRSNKTGKKLHDSATTSRNKATHLKIGKRPQSTKIKSALLLDDNSSELSELSDEEFEPYRLPTFVAALSSSGNSSSSESESGSGSTSESTRDNSHLRNTLSLINEDVISQRKKGHHTNWNVRMGKRGLGSAEISDAEMDTDSEDDDDNDDDEEEVGEGEGDGDENDEEIEDLGRPQLMRYSGIATGWTDDEESSFDADIFFANLSDSSTVSDDEQMGDAEVGFGEGDNEEDDDADEKSMDADSSSSEIDVMRLSEMAAAGFLAPFGGSGPSWEQLISSSLKESMHDIDEKKAREAYLNTTLEMTVPGYKEAEAMMGTSEEEEAVAMFDNCSQDLDLDVDEENNEMLVETEDCGDTTEDEFVDVGGVATPRHEVLLRFPASLGAIDPMSTVSSPIKSCMKDVTSMIPCTPAPRKPSRPVPKPSEILSGKIFSVSSKDEVEPQTPRAPSMGSFMHRTTEASKCAVINHGDDISSKRVPCPFPAVRRWRKRGGSTSALSHSGVRDMLMQSSKPVFNFLTFRATNPSFPVHCHSFDVLSN